MQLVAGSSSVSSAAARGGGVMQASVGSISRQVDGYAPPRACAPFTGRCQRRCQWLEQWGATIVMSGRWGANRRRQRRAENDWFPAILRGSAGSRSLSRGCLRSGLSRSGRCSAAPSSAKWRSNQTSFFCEVLKATAYDSRERHVDFDPRRYDGGTTMFFGMPRGLLSSPEDSRMMGHGLGSSRRDGGTRRLHTWPVYGQERSDVMGEGGDDDVEYMEEREVEKRGRVSSGSERGEGTREVEERTDVRKTGGSVGAAAASGASDGQTQGAGGGVGADVKWSARLGGWLGGKGILPRRGGEEGGWGGLKKGGVEESLAPVSVNMETDGDGHREGGGDSGVEGVGPVSAPDADVAGNDWLAEDEAEGLLAEGRKSVNGYRGWSSFVLVDNETPSSSSLLSAGVTGGGGRGGGDSGGKVGISVHLKEILSKGVGQITLGVLLGICLTAASFKISQRRVVLEKPGGKGLQLQNGPAASFQRTPQDRLPNESDETAQLARKFRAAATELLTMLEQRGRKGAIVKPVSPEEAQRLQKAAEVASKHIQTGQVTDKISKRVEDKLTKMRREYLLREQMKAIKEELGDNEDDDMLLLERRLEEARMPLNVWKHVQRELRLLKKMQPRQVHYGPERAYLELLADLPWSKSSEEKYIDLNEARKKLDEDHYGLAKVKKRIIEYLAVRRLKPDAAGPILCFVGPPGVGKTSLASSIAEVIGRKFVRISLGGVRDEADIRGHRRTYISSYPGRLIDGIKKVAVNNPVMLLDEIDKTGADMRGDPASALLEVLDPEQNKNFTDHYLNVPFDLSKVVFLATANRADPITPPLLDRMEVIELSGYTTREKVGIATRHLLPKVLKQHGLSEKHLYIPEGCIEFIIQRYTREAGVRDLERNLAAVCRSVAVTISERMALAEKQKEQRRKERREMREIARRSMMENVDRQANDVPAASGDEGDRSEGSGQALEERRAQVAEKDPKQVEKGEGHSVSEKEKVNDVDKKFSEAEGREEEVVANAEIGFHEAIEKMKRRLGESGGLLVVVLDARTTGMEEKEVGAGSSNMNQTEVREQGSGGISSSDDSNTGKTVEKEEDDDDEVDKELEEFERLVVDDEMLENILGPPKRDLREVEDRVSSPGVAVGLVWTEFGGDILFVEATSTHGKGDLRLTGRLGEMTKESAQIALTWVRAKAVDLLTREEDKGRPLMENRDLHVHFPEGAVPKDGPSAGVTMVTSLVSLLTRRPVRADTAMTGEITLRGVVLPVGGIKEKVMAANRCGIKRVIIPERNMKDLREVPGDILAALEVIPVHSVEQVLENAFEKATESTDPLLEKGSDSRAGADNALGHRAERQVGL